MFIQDLVLATKLFNGYSSNRCRSAFQGVQRQGWLSWKIA